MGEHISMGRREAVKAVTALAEFDVIASESPQVVVHFLDCPGAGSASRARRQASADAGFRLRPRRSPRPNQQRFTLHES
jgi:hypothetical protein